MKVMNYTGFALTQLRYTEFIKNFEEEYPSIKIIIFYCYFGVVIDTILNILINNGKSSKKELIK